MNTDKQPGFVISELRKTRLLPRAMLTRLSYEKTRLLPLAVLTRLNSYLVFSSVFIHVHLCSSVVSMSSQQSFDLCQQLFKNQIALAEKIVRAGLQCFDFVFDALPAAKQYCRCLAFRFAKLAANVEA